MTDQAPTNAANSILLGSEIDRLEKLAVQNRDQTEDNPFGWVHVDAVNTLRLIEDLKLARFFLETMHPVDPEHYCACSVCDFLWREE